MSILRRMRDMTVATFNEMLEQSEDPVRLIDKYLMAQKLQIVQSEKLYQQLSNHTGSLREQYLTARQWKEKRETQAMFALKAGEEDLARLALQEKIQQETTSEQYRLLYEQNQQAMLELTEQLKQLKADFAEIAQKRSYYEARLETVRLQQRMNERINRTRVQDTPRLFDRLDESITDLELEMSSLRDVRKIVGETFTQAGHGINQALERELLHLRKILEQEGWNQR